MEDGIGAVDDGLDGRVVANINAVKVNLGGEVGKIFGATSRQIVDDFYRAITQGQ